MPARQPSKRELPLFSQPVLSTPKSAVRRSQLSGLGLFALPTALCLGLLLVARPDNAQSQTSVADRLLNTLSGKEAAQEPTLEPSEDASERPPIWFYTQSVRGNLFSAPQPPAPKPVVVKRTPPPTPPPTPPVVVTVNPFQDWNYAGTVKMGEKIMALLENSKTKEGQYVSLGESIMGAQVTNLTEQQVTLMAAGKPITIAKSDSINVVPLSKSADYLNNAGQPGQPGQPGMPPGGMPQGMPQGMPGGMPPGFNPAMMRGRGQVMTMPNGLQVDGATMGRWNRNLNRRFNR